MIRERRDEDIDRLCAVLQDMRHPSDLLAGMDPEEWLNEHQAERSWVFDMAPVTVAPTKNVVGHVQIYRPADHVWTDHLVEHVERSASDLLIIGKLFIRPDTYEHGIGSYLLKESVRYIQGQGRLPVLELPGSSFLPRAFFEKLGFVQLAPGGPGFAAMIHTK